ncbi:PPE domain-containing protein [Nocardia takedensis]
MRELPTVTGERAPHTRTDPDYAPDVEVFDNLTHREIHEAVQQLDPAAINAGGAAWHGSAAGLADAVTRAHTEIRSLIADGWRGGAAATAADAVRAFERDGQRLADVMASVGLRLERAGGAAESLRAAVGTPGSGEPDLGAALLDPSQAAANIVTQKAVEHDRQDVVAAMDTMYTNAFLQSGVGVPAFPDIDQGAGVPGAGSTGQAVPTFSQLASVEVGTPVTQAVSTGTAVPAVAVAGTESTRAPAASAPAESTTAPAGASPVGIGGPVAAEILAPSPGQTVAASTQTPTTPVVTAAAPVAERPVSPASGAQVTAASAAPTYAPTLPGSGVRGSTDEDKREENKPREHSGDAVSGAGAGAFGGLVGGALAGGMDNARSGSSVGAPQVARPRQDDEDEDDDLGWFDDDDLTFLEPADEPDELIGALDPTTPPVVGEWTDLE